MLFQLALSENPAMNIFFYPRITDHAGLMELVLLDIAEWKYRTLISHSDSTFT